MRLARVPLAALVSLGALAETPAPPRPAFHSEPQAILEALLEANRAALREDAASVRAALDRLERGCRRLAPEEADSQGADVLALDKAYHAALTRAREFAGAGELTTAFDEMVWVARTCRSCHDFARRAGRLPASGPIW
jgi:hypothetical protein